MMSRCYLAICLCLCLLLWIDVHVEGLTAGLLLPIPRSPSSDFPFTGGVCSSQPIGAPKSTLYYGKNQIVVYLGDITPNNFRQLKLYGYVNSNSVNQSSTAFFPAGSYAGIAWSYQSDSSAHVLATVYNGTIPAYVPQGERLWKQTWEVDIPQGITCTPHCTLRLLGSSVSGDGSIGISVISCADVVLMERRPTSVYMTLRPDGCCPLEAVTVSRRLYEMFGSNISINPFAATSYTLWSYQTEMTEIVSNVWNIDKTAPNTFTINPQTGYYSVKLVVNDQYMKTAQQFITTITNTQLVSSALAPDSRGANNSYVWWGDAPNTYLPGGNPVAGANGKSINAASASTSTSIFTIATALIAVIVANAAHI